MNLQWLFTIACLGRCLNMLAICGLDSKLWSLDYRLSLLFLLLSWMSKALKLSKTSM